MSADHKRPLLAFFLVGVLCVLIMASGLRSEAVGPFRPRAAPQMTAAGELLQQYPSGSASQARRSPAGSVVSDAPTPTGTPSDVLPARVGQAGSSGQSTSQPSTHATVPATPGAPAQAGQSGSPAEVHQPPVTPPVTSPEEQQPGGPTSPGPLAGSGNAPDVVDQVSGALGDSLQGLSSTGLAGQGLHLGLLAADQGALAGIPPPGHVQEPGLTPGDDGEVERNVQGDVQADRHGPGHTHAWIRRQIELRVAHGHGWARLRR